MAFKGRAQKTDDGHTIALESEYPDPDGNTVANVPPEHLFRNLVGHRRLTEDELDQIQREGVVSVMGDLYNASDLLDVRPRWPKELFDGRPFTLLEWRFNDGAYDNEFVSMTVVDEHNRIGIINDGGTGVHDQLRRLTDKMGTQRGPIRCVNGLSKSDYFVAEDGTVYKHKPEGIKTTPAATWYLAG